MTGEPVRLYFDAETHPDPAMRVEAWRDAMSLSVDVAFEPDEAVRFQGRISFHPLGGILFVDTQHTPHTMVRDGTTIARTGYGHVILDLFPYGGFHGVVGGHPLSVGPGDGFLMDLKGTLHVHMKATRFLGLIIPRALFETKIGRAVHGLRLDAQGPEARLLGPLFETLATEAPRLSRRQADAVGLHLVGLLGACLADAGLRPAAKRAPRPVTPTPVQIRRYIERHAADSDLDPQRIGAAFGLSRTSLYRMFQAEGGIAELIRQRRAEIARSLLGARIRSYATTELIAQASGFSDVRSLRRALRDVYGATPSQLREAETAAERGPDRPILAIGAMFDRTDQ